MSYHILVVDDNETNLFLLGKILELEGYQVTIAHNGNEAIQSTELKRPDLALLDVMMPDMDGYELCQKMRQPPYNMKIPIVMLTAMDAEGEQTKVLEVGANEIWSKPFDMDILLKRIKELVKKD
jgi:CheY-like chemotaxis protein